MAPLPPNGFYDDGRIIQNENIRKGIIGNISSAIPNYSKASLSMIKETGSYFTGGQADSPTSTLGIRDALLHVIGMGPVGAFILKHGILEPGRELSGRFMNKMREARMNSSYKNMEYEYESGSDSVSSGRLRGPDGRFMSDSTFSPDQSASKVAPNYSPPKKPRVPKATPNYSPPKKPRAPRPTPNYSPPMSSGSQKIQSIDYANLSQGNLSDLNKSNISSMKNYANINTGVDSKSTAEIKLSRQELNELSKSISKNLSEPAEIKNKTLKIYRPGETAINANQSRANTTTYNKSLNYINQGPMYSNDMDLTKRDLLFITNLSKSISSDMGKLDKKKIADRSKSPLSTFRDFFIPALNILDANKYYSQLPRPRKVGVFNAINGTLGMIYATLRAYHVENNRLLYDFITLTKIIHGSNIKIKPPYEGSQTISEAAGKIANRASRAIGRGAIALARNIFGFGGPGKSSLNIEDYYNNSQGAALGPMGYGPIGGGGFSGGARGMGRGAYGDVGSGMGQTKSRRMGLGELMESDRFKNSRAGKIYKGGKAALGIGALAGTLALLDLAMTGGGIATIASGLGTLGSGLGGILGSAGSAAAAGASGIGSLIGGVSNLMGGGLLPTFIASSLLAGGVGGAVKLGAAGFKKIPGINKLYNKFDEFRTVEGGLGGGGGGGGYPDLNEIIKLLTEIRDCVCCAPCADQGPNLSPISPVSPTPGSPSPPSLLNKIGNFVNRKPGATARKIGSIRISELNSDPIFLGDAIVKNSNNPKFLKKYSDQIGGSITEKLGDKRKSKIYKLLDRIADSLSFSNKMGLFGTIFSGISGIVGSMATFISGLLPSFNFDKLKSAKSGLMNTLAGGLALLLGKKASNKLISPKLPGPQLPTGPRASGGIFTWISKLAGEAFEKLPKNLRGLGPLLRGGGRFLAKLMPGIGLLFSLDEISDRFNKGDYLGAAITTVGALGGFSTFLGATGINWLRDTVNEYSDESENTSDYGQYSFKVRKRSQLSPSQNPNAVNLESSKPMYDTTSKKEYSFYEKFMGENIPREDIKKANVIPFDLNTIKYYLLGGENPNNNNSETIPSDESTQNYMKSLSTNMGELTEDVVEKSPEVKKSAVELVSNIFSSISSGFKTLAANVLQLLGIDLKSLFPKKINTPPGTGVFKYTPKNIINNRELNSNLNKIFDEYEANIKSGKVLSPFISKPGGAYTKFNTNPMSNKYNFENVGSTGGIPKNTSMIDYVKNYIKSNEGLRLNVYNDSEGHPTIGYGHKITAGENYKSITLQQAEQLFEQDFAKIYNQVAQHPEFSKHNAAVDAVLIDLAYNMGENWYKEFPKFMNALSIGDYKTASNELLNSKYATQVGKRARMNSLAIFTGDVSELKVKSRGAAGSPASDLNTMSGAPAINKTYNAIDKTLSEKNNFIEVMGKKFEIKRQSPMTAGNEDMISNDAMMEFNGVIESAAPMPGGGKELNIRVPVADGRVTSQYGMRMHPIKGRNELHPGIDIAGPIGSPIKSWADGTVVTSHYSRSAGNFITIEHPNAGPGGKTLYTRYLHNDSNLVQVGQKIKKGDQIATMGNTGRSTGPHLHFEIRENNSSGSNGALDPLKFMNSSAAAKQPTMEDSIPTINKADMINDNTQKVLAPADLANRTVEKGLTNINDSLQNINTATTNTSNNITTFIQRSNSNQSENNNSQSPTSNTSDIDPLILNLLNPTS